MESDHRYYWPCASEELHAATPAARQRREELSRGLRTLGALRPEWPIERGPAATPAFTE